MRGLKLRCPNCGAGSLFSSYIKPVRKCAMCEECLCDISTDDAAPWLTILVVGHVIVPLMVYSASVDAFPKWASLILWPTLALLLAGAVLPHAKGVMLSLIWAERGSGSGAD